MHGRIPRTGGLPLLGALPSFLRDPLALLQRSQQTGDIGHLALGTLDAVVLHHPDYFDHVFREHHRRYVKEGPFWEQVRAILGNGLPTSSGDEWRRHRRMMQPSFGRRGLEGLTSLVIGALEDSLDWDDVGSSWSVLDVGARMPHLTMNVVSSAILGSSSSRGRAQRIAEGIATTTELSLWAMITHRLPRWMPLPGRERFALAAASMRREGLQLIQERRQRLEAGDDLLALMIAATDAETGEGMTDDQLLDETLSLLLAGYDTTSNGLQWALHLLTEHPEQLGRLREESDAVLHGRTPRVEDVRRLRYARWVMQEALRLYPPAWWLPRMAAQDDEIGGHAIAKGTIVAPVMYTVHRHPDFWPDPARFDPERFDPARAAGRHPMAWVPFGAGPRKCIGQELSLMESTLALAMITQRFELESCGHAVRPKLDTALRPAEGVRLRIRRRVARPRWISLRPSSSDSSTAMCL
ncbi:cytochrome P450 [Paraliomyxa miuraensis]|uniref:cytochrome P450 n=1 Tax=Paraliomyxa miuraensis TaxID=376150 RepID=UPI00224FD32C|nr:cytochrome P450 [Paraliomyxa miuraensis]MCX4240097.1 cytochrome P450 [Paraliomyxa miuraensis]